MNLAVSARSPIERIREFAGTVRHFWGSELFFRGMEGGDMRHVDSAWPLWNVFDLTPEGRGKDWYPALTYEGRD